MVATRPSDGVEAWSAATRDAPQRVVAQGYRLAVLAGDRPAVCD